MSSGVINVVTSYFFISINLTFAKKKDSLKHPISITAIASISPLGISPEEAWKNYQKQTHCITLKNKVFVAELSSGAKKQIEILRNSDDKYKRLDNSVLYAIYASRQAVKQAGWKDQDNFGINIGSSRGATALFEAYHRDFLDTNKSKTLSSPTTTLGNISSWVAHDLQTQGPEISHSITCSTALHAMLNGIAWLNSGMSDKFLVGGSEAPLTPFTIAQMQALKIYAKSSGAEALEVPKNSKSSKNEILFPCRSLDLEKNKNTMILGEAASVACLEKGVSKNALAIIEGVGFATEVLKNNTSISENAECFKRSMAMALDNLDPNEIDIIVTHTPGTMQGDQAEYNAITEIFCNKIPSLTTNKWKIGHSLGASGLLSIEMAVIMLNKQEFISVPFLKTETPKRIKNILVNAVGFGGNAVSILLSK
jgi:3-oxoacyl-(acyl-carrier-protein) synthase